MKIKVILILFVVSFFCCGIATGQNDFVILTSSDFIKGLDSKDYLREKLAENGFTKVGEEGIGFTKAGFFEYWKLKSEVLVDIIQKSGQESTIKVGVHEDYTGFPDRLISSFPSNESGKRDNDLSAVNESLINKNISYSLVCSRDTDVVSVFIWFDKPYYFFEYKHQKQY